MVRLLFEGVDLADERVGLGAGVAAVDMEPIGFGCGGLALREHLAAGRALMDLGHAVDPSRGEGQVGYLAFGPIAPSGHHPVVDIGPERSGLFDGVLARHAYGAARSPTPAAFHLNIEGSDMGVRVLGIVAALIMDRGDIPSNIFGQGLAEGPHKGLALLGGRLDGQGQDEPFTDPSLAGFGFPFGCNRDLRVGGVR